MRYVIAMAGAIVVALLVTLFVSQPLASWVVEQFTFDSPDTVADLHTAVYMLSNLTGLLIGWIVGWIIGGRLVKRVPVA
jgi:hypothetical protein